VEGILINLIIKSIQFYNQFYEKKRKKRKTGKKEKKRFSATNELQSFPPFIIICGRQMPTIFD
jgi:hypothetical protein